MFLTEQKQIIYVLICSLISYTVVIKENGWEGDKIKTHVNKTRLVDREESQSTQTNSRSKESTYRRQLSYYTNATATPNFLIITDYRVPFC